MRVTVWTNHVFRPEALAWLQARLDEAGHRLIVSATATASVLAAGQSDPGLAEADVAFGQPDPQHLLRCPGLRWLELSSAGYTRYDRDDLRSALRAQGVPVTNTSAVFADPCAQHVLAQMLALVRNLPVQWRNQDGVRDWRYLEDRFTNGVLTGQQVLLLGFGAIGRRLTELLRPFGCRIAAHRRTAQTTDGVEPVAEADLLRVLGTADHVVNILPETDATRGWMSAAYLAAMKPGGRYYNIGRGATTDQTALIAALRDGRIGAAYLDVMDPEPLPPDHPLWSTPNCYLTCHIGGGTGDQDEKLARHFFANLQAWLAGAPLTDRIF